MYIPLVLWKELLEAALDQHQPSPELKRAIGRILRVRKEEKKG